LVEFVTDEHASSFGKRHATPAVTSGVCSTNVSD
jgi:hypothetical protein